MQNSLANIPFSSLPRVTWMIFNILQKVRVEDEASERHWTVETEHLWPVLGKRFLRVETLSFSAATVSPLRSSSITPLRLDSALYQQVIRHCRWIDVQARRKDNPFYTAQSERQRAGSVGNLHTIIRDYKWDGEVCLALLLLLTCRLYSHRKER